MKLPTTQWGYLSQYEFIYYSCFTNGQVSMTFEDKLQIGPFEFLEASDCKTVQQQDIFNQISFRLPFFSCS